MKKNQETKLLLPAFSSEAEEADWWHKNRKDHARQFALEVAAGHVQVLTKEKLRQRLAASKKAASPAVALRIPAADIVLARRQAELKGLSYQSYIKLILHRTLIAREKRRLS